MPVVFEPAGPFNPAISEAYGALQQRNLNRQHFGNYGGGGGGGSGGGGGGNPHAAEMQQAQIDAREREVQFMADQQMQALSQQETMRLQRLQGGLGIIQEQVDAGTLSADEGMGLRMQLQTGINPLVQRQARAQQQAQEQHMKDQHQAFAMQSAMEATRARIRDQSLAQFQNERDENVRSLETEMSRLDDMADIVGDDPNYQAYRSATERRLRAAQVEAPSVLVNGERIPWTIDHNGDKRLLYQPQAITAQHRADETAATHLQQQETHARNDAERQANHEITEANRQSRVRDQNTGMTREVQPAFIQRINSDPAFADALRRYGPLDTNDVHAMRELYVKYLRDQRLGRAGGQQGGGGPQAGGGQGRIQPLTPAAFAQQVVNLGNPIRGEVRPAVPPAAPTESAFDRRFSQLD